MVSFVKHWWVCQGAKTRTSTPLQQPARVDSGAELGMQVLMARVIAAKPKQPAALLQRQKSHVAANNHDSKQLA